MNGRALPLSCRNTPLPVYCRNTPPPPISLSHFNISIHGSKLKPSTSSLSFSPTDAAPHGFRPSSSSVQPPSMAQNSNPHLPAYLSHPQTLAPHGFRPSSSSVQEAYDNNMLQAYYQDPSVASSLKSWAFEVLNYYESLPNPTGAIMPPTNPGFKPHSTRETIVSQSVWWCEVCNVKCDTKEVLNKHKMGKKHKKKEEKLKDSTTPPPPAASGLCVNLVIEPEDLESKRRKLMKEGADPDAVMMCEICNVVCNNDLVFAQHTAGRKHVLKQFRLI